MVVSGATELHQSLAHLPNRMGWLRRPSQSYTSVSRTQLPHTGTPYKGNPKQVSSRRFCEKFLWTIAEEGSRLILVDQDVIKQEIQYLLEFAMIASFVVPKPSTLQQWLAQLRGVAKGTIALGQHLGRGFFILKAGSIETVQSLLLLIPHRSQFGLCIFQRWVVGFDPDAKRGIASSTYGAARGLSIPTWLTLQNLKGNLRGVAK
jgi:hypothetical protein